MDRPYDAIGDMLLTGAEFENAYSMVIAAGKIASHHLDQVLLSIFHPV